MRRFRFRDAVSVVVALAVLAIAAYFIFPGVRTLVDDWRDPVPVPTFTPTDSPDCSLAEVPEPLTVNVGVVVDPTSSTASSFSQGVISELAAQLGEHMPDKPDEPQNGIPTVNAINITIKQVGDNPYAYGAETLSIKIPGVKGLPQRPDVSCMSEGTYQQWGDLEKAWSVGYDTALNSLTKGIENIKTMPLRNEYSGIRAALSALVVALPPGDHAAYLVASDFEENRPVQTAGNLNGHALVLIDACPSGDATACSTNVETFGNWASDSLGAGATSVYRHEQMSTAIDLLFEEAKK